MLIYSTEYTEPFVCRRVHYYVWSCVCHHGWTGNLCQYSSCSNVRCLNGGQAKSQPNGQCVCSKCWKLTRKSWHFHNSFCDIRTSVCQMPKLSLYNLTFHQFVRSTSKIFKTFAVDCTIIILCYRCILTFGIENKFLYNMAPCNNFIF